MKRNVWKSLMALILCLCLSTMTAAAAEGNPADEPETGTPIETVTDSTAQNNLLRANQLCNGTVQLSHHGNGLLYISGTTNCYRTCPSVKLGIFLERKVDGVWRTVDKWYYEDTNTYRSNHGFYYTVKKGYYYRLKGAHSAAYNGNTESANTCTSGIYVN